MEKTKKDYRHYICWALIAVFAVVGITLFSNSFWRIWESVRDLGTSIAYCFCEGMDIKHDITPTVTQLSIRAPWLPTTPSFPSLEPTLSAWEQFKIDWAIYWKLFFNQINFLLYLLNILRVLDFITTIVMFALPIYLLVRALFSSYLIKYNDNDDKDSNNLIRFKKFSDLLYRPVKKFIKDFFVFLSVYSRYWKIWLCMALLFFNGFTILIEFIAFYLYFAATYDVIGIIQQIHKLVLDLTDFFTFVPLWALIVIGVIVWEFICQNIAYDKLDHRERKNYGMLNERGVVTIVWGEMGVGKTLLISDMALTAEKKLRDQAFEIILECDMKFPFFTWATFQRQLRQAIYFHVIYDIWSCKRWVKKQYRKWLRSPCRQHVFGYDYERYGLTYDDKLAEVDIWETLVDYAQAYLIYTVQSSLIFSTYSIRVDGLLYDLENFPVWNMNFFKRDSRLLDAYSRNAHILDFDMLRLGKTMLENNPNRYAFGFGVYVITEIDKERKNTPGLKDVDKLADECNQKNDLFELLVMLSRHACVVANRVFVIFLADLQRPDNLGAVSRELGEVSYIESKDNKGVTLPFFSPFHFIAMIGDLLTKPFKDIYTQYCVHRSDNTLPLYLYKKFTAAFEHYRDRTEKLFGSTALHLEMQSGRMDGKKIQRKWYRQDKKIFPKRYATNCASAIFETRGEMNRIGVDDCREYLGIIASQEERIYQNSHMQVELEKCAV